MKTITNTILALTEQDVNELRFMIANLNSPSQKKTKEIADEWVLKLTMALRKARPLQTPTVNVN